MNQIPEKENEKTRILSPVKISFGLLTLALLLNGTALFGLIGFFDFSINFKEISNFQNFRFFYFAVFTVFVITLSAWVMVIYRFRIFHQNLLRADAERVLAENALKTSESRLRELLENANDIIYTTDLKGNFTSLNKVGEKVTGYALEEALVRNISDVIAPEYLELARQMLASKINGSSPTIYELEIITKNNERVAIELSSRVIYEGDKPIGSQGIARDITVRRRDEEALKQSEERYRFLSEGIIHQVWTAHSDGKLDYVNDRTIGYFDCSAEQIIDDGWQDFVHPDDLHDCLQKWKYSIETGEYYECKFRLKRFDGEYRWHTARATPGLDADSKITKWFGTNTDVDEQIRSDAALRTSESKFRTLLENMGEGLVQVNNDSVIEFANERFCKMTGYERDELLGKKTFEMLFDEESARFLKERNQRRLKGISENYEIGLKHKSGERLWVLVGGAPTYGENGEIIGSMGVFTDITERKRSEEKLMHDAFHDALTGLANRALFTDHLRLRIERAKREKKSLFGVLFLDFDRFKVINDSLGHAEGDKLLIAVAKRLETTLRSSDLIARLGGDEFTILLNELDDSSHATQIATRIQELLNAPFELEGGEIFMSASIGIALGTDGTINAEDMLRNADIAMYRAKSKGKARHQLFDQAMHDEALNQLQIETDLRQALGRDEFRLHYQPIYNLETKTILGFEALIRWKHPSRGMVPPDEFIPIVEENGLIIPLGRWIMYESCRQMREWQDLNPGAMNLTMSVNLSCKQFLQNDLAEQVMAMLVATRLEPQFLKLEITESHVMENSDAAVKMMNRLRSLGIELSLDDFGTGYSSLSYLHRLPVTNLKIDRSFVNQMVVGDENSKLVSTIITLAHNLNINVTAEGIETDDQLEQLKELSCEKGQGYYFSKPLEAEAATELINNLPIPTTSQITTPDRNLDLIG